MFKHSYCQPSYIYPVPDKTLKMISHPPKALVMAEVPNELALSGSSLVVLSVLAFALEQPILSLVSKDWHSNSLKRHSFLCACRRKDSLRLVLLHQAQGDGWESWKASAKDWQFWNGKKQRKKSGSSFHHQRTSDDDKITVGWLCHRCGGDMIERVGLVSLTAAPGCDSPTSFTSYTSATI